MWFQDGPTDDQVLVYGYTGWQYGIARATFDVARCAVLQEILSSYNALIASNNALPAANHGIVTQYRTGQDCIGMHFDKAHNIADGSLITIVKLGPSARPFRIETLEGELLFEQWLRPGAAVIMTKESNLACRHGVPAVADPAVGLSGSLVLRTITRVESVATIRKRSAKTNQRRQSKKNKKQNQGEPRDDEEDQSGAFESSSPTK